MIARPGQEVRLSLSSRTLSRQLPQKPDAALARLAAPACHRPRFTVNEKSRWLSSLPKSCHKTNLPNLLVRLRAPWRKPLACVALPCCPTGFFQGSRQELSGPSTLSKMGSRKALAIQDENFQKVMADALQQSSTFNAETQRVRLIFSAFRRYFGVGSGPPPARPM